MVKFSDRANSIQPTGVRRMFDMAGDDTVQFGLGEPDFQPPKLAIKAFNLAMEQVYIRNQEKILAEFILNDVEDRKNQ